MTAVLLGIITVRVVSIIVAALCLYLAYKLFFVNTEQQGYLEANGAGLSFKIRKVAPGVFFAIVGAVIMAFSLRPISYTHTINDEGQTLDGTSSRRWEDEHLAGAAAPVKNKTVKAASKK